MIRRHDGFPVLNDRCRGLPGGRERGGEKGDLIGRRHKLEVLFYPQRPQERHLSCQDGHNRALLPPYTVNRRSDY
jgi:hypothetical protein